MHLLQHEQRPTMQPPRPPPPAAEPQPSPPSSSPQPTIGEKGEKNRPSHVLQAGQLGEDTYDKSSVATSTTCTEADAADAVVGASIPLSTAGEAGTFNHDTTNATTTTRTNTTDTTCPDPFTHAISNDTAQRLAVTNTRLFAEGSTHSTDTDGTRERVREQEYQELETDQVNSNDGRSAEVEAIGKGAQSQVAAVPTIGRPNEHGQQYPYGGLTLRPRKSPESFEQHQAPDPSSSTTHSNVGTATTVMGGHKRARAASQGHTFLGPLLVPDHTDNTTGAPGLKPPSEAYYCSGPHEGESGTDTKVAQPVPLPPPQTPPPPRKRQYKGRGRSSSVWDYFCVNPNGTYTCSRCKDIFSRKSSTSTLGKHWGRFHVAAKFHDASSTKTTRTTTSAAATTPRDVAVLGRAMLGRGLQTPTPSTNVTPPTPTSGAVHAPSSDTRVMARVSVPEVPGSERSAGGTLVGSSSAPGGFSADIDQQAFTAMAGIMTISPLEGRAGLDQSRVKLDHHRHGEQHEQQQHAVSVAPSKEGVLKYEDHQHRFQHHHPSDTPPPPPLLLPQLPTGPPPSSNTTATSPSSFKALKERCDDALLQLALAEDAFRLLDSPQFRGFCHALNPGYVVPSIEELREFTMLKFERV